jgi:hypothetical protein
MCMRKSTTGRWTSHVKTKVRNRQLHNIIRKIEGNFFGETLVPAFKLTVSHHARPIFRLHGSCLQPQNPPPPIPRHWETLRNVLVFMVGCHQLFHLPNSSYKTAPFVPSCVVNTVYLQPLSKAREHSVRNLMCHGVMN